MYIQWYNKYSIFREEIKVTNLVCNTSLLKALSNIEISDYNPFEIFYTSFSYVSKMFYNIIKKTSLSLTKRHRTLFLKVLIVFIVFTLSLQSLLFGKNTNTIII